MCIAVFFGTRARVMYTNAIHSCCVYFVQAGPVEAAVEAAAAAPASTAGPSKNAAKKAEKAAKKAAAKGAKSGAAASAGPSPAPSYPAPPAPPAMKAAEGPSLPSMYLSSAGPGPLKCLTAAKFFGVEVEAASVNPAGEREDRQTQRCAYFAKEQANTIPWLGRDGFCRWVEILY